MYFSLFLIFIIALLTWLYFVCIKRGTIDTKKSCWLLPPAIVILYVVYGFYGVYPKTVIPLAVIISLFVYIEITMKA